MSGDEDRFDWIAAGPPYEGPPATLAREGSDPLRKPDGPVVDDRYAALDLEDESVIVYDCRETNAWLQSSHAIPLEDDEAAAETDGAAAGRPPEQGERGR